MLAWSSFVIRQSCGSKEVLVLFFTNPNFQKVKIGSRIDNTPRPHLKIVGLLLLNHCNRLNRRSNSRTLL